MIKAVLRISLFALLLVSAPTLMYGGESSIVNNELQSIDKQNISVSISGTTLRVTGANGNVLNVYNLTGMRVLSVKVEGMDKHYELSLPAGCYIVKVGNFTRKIYIK